MLMGYKGNTLEYLMDNDWMEFFRNVPPSLFTIKKFEFVYRRRLYEISFDPKDEGLHFGPHPKKSEAQEKPYVLDIHSFKDTQKGRKITGVQSNSGRRYESFVDAMRALIKETELYKTVPMSRKDFE